MARQTYVPVATPTLLKLEPCKTHGWIASVQTPDGILMWFGINPESHAVFKTGSRRIIGRGDCFSNHFIAARTVAVAAIREAERQSREAVNDPAPPQEKVVPITWHHKYDLAGAGTE